MSEDRIAKAGTLLCVDHGEFSDYGVTGFFVVLRDFDPRAELEEFLSANPAQRGHVGFERGRYLAALLAKGLLLEIEYGTLYLGSYMSPADFNFTPC